MCLRELREEIEQKSEQEIEQNSEQENLCE